MQNLRCSIHPAQNITNFCTREQCLAQLCATCICHHTDMHAINGTLPHYQNIQQTYKTAYQIIDAQRAVIENEKKRIISYNQGWEKKKQEIYQRIKIAKKDVLQLVQKTFSQLEQRHIQVVKQEEMKMGMKDCDKVMKMIQGYNTQSEKLFNLQKQLLSIRAPQALKKLYTEAMPLSNNLISRISTDISLLEAHNIRVDYIQPNLLNLKQCINNLLALQIKYPQPIKQPEIIVKETIVRQPLLQVIEGRVSQSQGPLYQTCSTFYGRPQSAGKSIPGKVSYVNGRSQLLMQATKPKISVISGRVSNPLGESRLLLRNSRRTNIFPDRPVSQLR